MNAIHATPRTPTTVSIACPWCDEPLAVDDAFAALSVRCSACATSIDFEPVRIGTPERSTGSRATARGGPGHGLSNEIAA